MLEAFLKHPPLGFQSFWHAGTPAFVTPYDLTTTLDAQHRQVLLKQFWYPWVRSLLTPLTLFVGSTVSEYACWSAALLEPGALATWVRQARRDYPLMIIKDLPAQSSLLSRADQEAAAQLAQQARDLGFIEVAGQALAWVPIEGYEEASYLAQFSRAHRKDLRRKLRQREQLRIDALHAGDPRLLDAQRLQHFYRLYEQVYEQSQIHFDKLSPEFFQAILQAGTGAVVFTYHQADELIGYNICFEWQGLLIDKYIGLSYPQARQCNLYFVSWFHNLAYARARGLKFYVAGWTDPEVKAYLGARFAMTRHLVYFRNPIMRTLLRPLRAWFESDAATLQALAQDDPGLKV